MLKQIQLRDIVLVDRAVINLDRGLNVLSGETGSGKSAIMEGLSQIAGARSDSSLVRKGAEKGFIQAVFDPSNLPRVHQLLTDSGVPFDPHEDLIIAREISAAGKSRGFINNQQVHISLLKQLGEQLLEIVGQQANQKLLSTDWHRRVLDLYGSLEGLAGKFAESWKKEGALKQKLADLQSSESERLREIDKLTQELQEIETVSPKPGEDEELFAEYTRHVNGEELAASLKEITDAYSEAILPALNAQSRLFDQLVNLDPSMEELSTTHRNLALEMQELDHTLAAYWGKTESCPAKMAELNDRLSLINKIKKKYGPAIEDALAYRDQARQRLDTLEGSDLEIEGLQKEIESLEAHNHALAGELSKKRKSAASKLEKELTSQIRSLNMKNALFFVQIEPQRRNAQGDDKVEFFIAPNKGENSSSLKDGASGGELSRVMLALQTILSGKEEIPTMIFDEIDASIGGATATIIGEKLREIGQRDQVLCITHFSQVARQGDLHFQVSKREIGERTVTTIELLDGDARETELARMQGLCTLSTT